MCFKCHGNVIKCHILRKGSHVMSRYLELMSQLNLLNSKFVVITMYPPNVHESTYTRSVMTRIVCRS